MPGTYAHLTAVGIAKGTTRLEAAGLPGPAILAILKNARFLDLGAISPDYPYLAHAGAHEPSKKWADLMHYARTGEILREGVRRLRAKPDPKRFAWLLGYAAHVVADITLHPVVELKVGPYQGNEAAHRICEMHQDSYIFQRMNVGDIGLAEYLDSGVGRCGEPGHPKRLDSSISGFWRDLLAHGHSAEAGSNAPAFDLWHEWFLRLVDGVAEEAQNLIPLARHVAAGKGLTYPKPSEVDRAAYIDALKTPEGEMPYDRIFDRAVGNIIEMWRVIAVGVYGDSDEFLTYIRDWNLDTGRDPAGNLTMWRQS